MKLAKAIAFALALILGNNVFAQNVGIGTSTPLEKLHIVGNTRISGLAGAGTRMVGTDANGTLVVVAAGTNGQVLTQTAAGPAFQANPNWTLLGNSGTVAATNFIGTTDAIDFVVRTSNVQRMIVRSTGNIGINVPAPSNQLHVGGDVRVGLLNPSNTGTLPGYGSRIYFSGGPSGPNYDSDNSDPAWMSRYNAASDLSEIRMNLSDNCSGGDAFVIQTGGSGCGVTDYFRFDGAGNAYKLGGGAWATLSDRRVKREILPYSDGLEVLKQIEPVKFQYNGLGNTANNDKEYIGVIAQDLQKVAPYMVNTDDEYLRVDPSAFTYILINAVQSQQNEIEALKSQMEKISKELEAIKAAKN